MVLRSSVLLSSASRRHIGVWVLPASAGLISNGDACARVVADCAASRRLFMLRIKSHLSSASSLLLSKMQTVPWFAFWLFSRYISRYASLKFGFLPFVVATIVAIVFYHAVFAARTPAMGTARTERGSSHSSWKGSRLLATPATAACLTCRPDIVCPNRLGGMMQPAKAAHSAFLARRKLASGSSRAPCAFPNLRCYPRCWLFSCLGMYFHLRISPKSTKRSAAAILGRSAPSLLFMVRFGIFCCRQDFLLCLT